MLLKNIPGPCPTSKFDPNSQFLQKDPGEKVGESPCTLKRKLVKKNGVKIYPYPKFFFNGKNFSKFFFWHFKARNRIYGPNPIIWYRFYNDRPKKSPSNLSSKVICKNVREKRRHGNNPHSPTYEF